MGGPLPKQSITNNVNNDISDWKNWIAGETTRINGLIGTANSTIAAWNSWLSSNTAALNTDIQSWQTSATNAWNNYTSFLTTDAARLNTWIQTTSASDLSRLNAWLKTQSDNVYAWYTNAWNQLNAGVSNAGTWVQNTINNYDGGQWESDIGLSLTDNPWDTLTQTYNNIISSLSTEAQDTYNSDVAGFVSNAQATYNSDIAAAKTQADNFISNANTQIAGFNQQIQNLTTEANNAISRVEH